MNFIAIYITCGRQTKFSGTQWIKNFNLNGLTNRTRQGCSAQAQCRVLKSAIWKFGFLSRPCVSLLNIFYLCVRYQQIFDGETKIITVEFVLNTPPMLNAPPMVKSKSRKVVFVIFEITLLRWFCVWRRKLLWGLALALSYGLSWNLTSAPPPLKFAFLFIFFRCTIQYLDKFYTFFWPSHEPKNWFFMIF